MIISPTWSQWWHMVCKIHCPLQRLSSVYLCLVFGSSVYPLVIYFLLQCGFFHPSLFVMIVFNYTPNYNWRGFFSAAWLFIARIKKSMINLSTDCFLYETVESRNSRPMSIGNLTIADFGSVLWHSFLFLHILAIADFGNSG